MAKFGHHLIIDEALWLDVRKMTAHYSIFNDTGKQVPFILRKDFLITH